MKQLLGATTSNTYINHHSPQWGESSSTVPHWCKKVVIRLASPLQAWLTTYQLMPSARLVTSRSISTSSIVKTSSLPLRTRSIIASAKW